MLFCVQVKVTNILSAIDAAEYLITHNASHVVKQVKNASRGCNIYHIVSV